MASDDIKIIPARPEWERVRTDKYPPLTALLPLEIRQQRLIDTIHVSFQRIKELVSNKREVTPSALRRLVEFLGVSENLHMGLQVRRK